MSILVPYRGADILTVYLDFETQSACNLRKHGAYVYAEHPSTSVLCAAIWVVGREDMIFWTPERIDGLVMPPAYNYEYGLDFLVDMVTAQPTRIEAQNHAFERAIWTRCLPRFAAAKGLVLPEPAEWGDTMDILLSRGLPAGLDAAGSYLFGMPKDAAGQAILRSIWGPDKTGRLPVPTTAQIQGIIEYNGRDTVVSAAVAHRFGNVMTTNEEERVRRLHHKVNHRGIHLDKDFARTLRDWDEVFKVKAAQQVEEVTHGQIKRSDLTRREFLRQTLNTQLPQHLYLQNMRADSLERLIDPEEDCFDEVDPDVQTVIKNYLVFSRAALSKVDRALNVVAADGRAHAQLRYWGAATGRWSGYEIQPQNLKKPNEDLDIAAANTLIEERCVEMAAGRWTPEMDAAMLEDFAVLCKDMPPYELLGSLIRGILHPGEGRVFVVGDFAQVEARGILWLAGDDEGLVEHRASDHGGPDVYCVLASSMYGKPITKKDKGPRSGGKIGVLACLAPETLVITSNGVKTLISVTLDDKVWDGDSWVEHSGLVVRGVRDVIEWRGLVLTPDHLVWTGEGWCEVGKLSAEAESQALEVAAEGALVADHRLEGRFWREAEPRIPVYDLASCGPRSRFTVLTLDGPVIVHNCGFGGGDNAVSRMAASYGIDLAALGINARFVVDGYRNKYPKVVKLWQDYEYAFRRVLTSTRGDSYSVGRCEFVKRDDCVQIILPSGRPITYTNARIMDDPYGKRDREGGIRRVIAYDMATKGKVVVRTTYGGKIAENCWTRDSVVLCRSGPTLIANVTAEDEVWDGVEWVRTAGAKSMGVQEVGTWLGTRVTGNHQIHDGRSWKAVMQLGVEHSLAALAWGRGLAPSSFSEPGAETMRSANCTATAGQTTSVKTGPCSVGRTDAPSADGTQLEPTARPTADTSTSSPTTPCEIGGCIATPAWSPDAPTPSTAPTPTMAAGGSPSAMNGSETGERSCDTLSPSHAGMKTASTWTGSTTPEATSPATCDSSPGRSTPGTPGATHGSSAKGDCSPLRSSMSDTAPNGAAATPSSGTSAGVDQRTGLWHTTGERSEVFDLMNCGPRSRFMVLTPFGPIIAHNCTQAFCRDLLSNRMLVLDDDGMDIDFHVHDEVIASVPEADGEAAVAYMAQVLRDLPDWAKGFPLWSNPGVMRRYGKD